MVVDQIIESHSLSMYGIDIKSVLSEAKAQTEETKFPGRTINPVGHGRSVGEQVKSGFQIAGLMVLAFCSFVALAVGLRLATGPVESGRNDHRLLDAMVVAAMIVFLYGTVRYWARWLVGFLGLGLWRMWYA
jgi:hypothetical protein